MPLSSPYLPGAAPRNLRFRGAIRMGFATEAVSFMRLAPTNNRPGAMPGLSVFRTGDQLPPAPEARISAIMLEET